MKVVDGLHWFTALLYYNSNRLIFSFRLIGSTGRRKITVVTESAAVSAGSSTEKLWKSFPGSRAGRRRIPQSRCGSEPFTGWRREATHQLVHQKSPVRWQQKWVRQTAPESQRASDVSLSGAWETDDFFFCCFVLLRAKKNKKISNTSIRFCYVWLSPTRFWDHSQPNGNKCAKEILMLSLFVWTQRSLASDGTSCWQMLHNVNVACRK